MNHNTMVDISSTKMKKKTLKVKRASYSICKIHQTNNWNKRLYFWKQENKLWTRVLQDTPATGEISEAF